LAIPVDKNVFLHVRPASATEVVEKVQALEDLMKGLAGHLGQHSFGNKQPQSLGLSKNLSMLFLVVPLEIEDFCIKKQIVTAWQGAWAALS